MRDKPPQLTHTVQAKSINILSALNKSSQLVQQDAGAQCIN